MEIFFIYAVYRLLKSIQPTESKQKMANFKTKGCTIKYYQHYEGNVQELRKQN